MQYHRRKLLLAAAGASLGSIAVIASRTCDAQGRRQGRKKPPPPPTEEANSPPEQLMLEHAVGERLLLIYQEGVRRLRASEAVSAGTFSQAAGLLRRVIEDYHQKREEDNIFPRFETRADLAPLVKTLRAQHAAGRKLTDTILDSASVEKFAQPEARKALLRACEAYLRMARPHMAQEATKVLQALYDVLPEEKIDRIGALFQEQEKQLFGEDGLDKVLEDIDRLEAELQIGALDVFTPSDV